MPETLEKVVIIGAGPAGIAAALQLRRYGFDLVVFEAGPIGGLLHNANWVENYPGFPGGISGPDLVALFADQFQAASVRLRSEWIRRIEHDNVHFLLESSSGMLLAHSVIVASGTQPIEFNDFPLTPEVQDKIFYEVFPLRSSRKKELAIVGAGDAAFDYALNLSRHNKVTILSRSRSLKALPLLQDRVRENPRISLLTGITLTRIERESSQQLLLQVRQNDTLRRLTVDALVFALGRRPRLDFLPPAWETAGNRPENLYLCGDVVNGPFRQVAISIGQGVRTAMEFFFKTGER